MPDVRMPNGTVIKNVPAGTTQSELQARLNKVRGPSIGPSNMSDREIRESMFREVHGQAQEIEQETPWINRPDSGAEVAPLALGVGGSMLVPGGGWAALALQSLVAGAGTATGKLAQQKIMREEIDPAQATKEGAVAAGSNFAGGAILKGLGAFAKKIFSSPLDKPARAAAEFAKQEGAPFPLASAIPGSGAARTQQATRVLLPGEIRTQVDANKVAHFLNNRVSTIVDNASPVDEAAAKGQQYLRQAFEPGETVYTQTFQKLRSTVGDETAIPLTNTREAMEGVSESLKQRGEMKAVYNRIRNILKANPSEQTAAQLDELYSGLLKDTARNANARREANVVLSAIAKDIDGVAKDFGVSFTDDIAKAKAVRDQFRELRNIPQLERLAKDFGDKGGTLGSRQWMAEMFANPNGKALAELRARNPELYHELADSWLASNINRFSRPTESSIGRVLDGQKFRAWFEQNEANLKVVFGAPQTKALDNFSLYAQHMAGAVSRANAGSKGLDPTAMLFRAGAEGTGMVTQPFIFVPGEAASYVLAKGLSDPSSSLFRVFTEGFKEPTKALMRRSGQIAGQSAGMAVADGQNQR